MVNRWLKTNSLIAATVSFWLAALSPVPPIAKGLSYSLALIAGVQLIQESERLMKQSARTIALDAMNQELEQLEIALHTQLQEDSLTEAYAPEVKQELQTALEHLYQEESAVLTSETSTSTSDGRALYLAVKFLLESRGETFILEKILKLSGGQWDKGKQRLQQILDEGKANGW